ncbi:MAG: hypothetical protein KC635_15200, partial [Myxococcales bacterium]|nr:hypothetical protein [Myxococcales bacterium]
MAREIPIRRALLGAATMTLLLAGCIEAGRGPAVETDTLATTCTSDGICDDGNACTDDRCEGGTCVRTPVSAGAPCVSGAASEACVAGSWHAPDACNDVGECVDGGATECTTATALGPCELATCDPTGGCGVELRPAGARCVAEDGQSDACDGSTTYYREDTCDKHGVCVEGGVEECLTGECASSTCEVGVGCSVLSKAEDGTACHDGYSKMCIDDAYHAADLCRAGACVNGAVTPCEDTFCNIGSCGAVGCVSTPIGIHADVTGTWSVVALRQEAERLVLLRGGVAIDETQWQRVGAIEASGVTGGWANDGPYCVSATGALQLSIGATATSDVTQAPATEVSGQVSADGRVFAATSRGERPALV